MSKKYKNDNDDRNDNDNDSYLRVEHVKEVELGVDGDRGLFPRCVRGRPFLDHHLLCKYQSSKDISQLETEYRVDDVVEELVGKSEKGDACKDGHRGPQQKVNKFTPWPAGDVVALRHVKLLHTVVALQCIGA